MSNSKKFLKLFLSIGVATTAVVITSYSVVSCGHKSNGGGSDGTTWDDYKKLGMKATAANIAMNATADVGEKYTWDTSTASNFSFTSGGGIIPIDDHNLLATTIVYKPTQEKGEFEATYVKGHKYSVSDWRWEGIA